MSRDFRTWQYVERELQNVPLHLPIVVMVCQLPRLRRVSGCGLVLLGQFFRPERAPINLNGGRRVLCHSFEPVGIRERGEGGREGGREKEREREREKEE